MKKSLKIATATFLLAVTSLGMVACSSSSSTKDKISALESQMQELVLELENTKKSFNNSLAEISPLGTASYKKLKYIDSELSDRDCMNGENFKQAQQYIKNTALKAGYSETDISFQEVPVTQYVKKDNLGSTLSAVKSYTTDGKSYSSAGRWNYKEDENGEYAKVTFITENIIVNKKGKQDKQIIVGMHYDGTGSGDNGSGVALGLSTLENIKNTETDLSIKFIFFTAEEYGCYGSSYYANNMSDEEVNNTLYMINMDSLVCGDYTYLYGGVQDNQTKTVTKTEAYDNAMNLAKSFGLEFKSNPWTWDNIAPDNYDEEYPDYASPSTGNWSDHKGFKNKGITYLYFEATNWEIPDYTGYGESVLAGMIMNTDNDYLEYIETYYPGRPLAHLTKFATLLNGLCMQTLDSYNGFVK